MNNRNDALKTESAFSPYFTYMLSKFDGVNECSEELHTEMARNISQHVGTSRKKEFNSVCIPAESWVVLKKILQDSTGL